MNKTIKISLSRTAFIIDEEAFKTLEHYLNTLEVQFRNNSSSKEILEEIEQRLAELFSEKCSEGCVVSNEMVKEAIETLGSASEIEGNEQKQEKRSDKNKKLFRDTSNNVIGGVFSGVAAYFNWDVSIVRIIAVILTLLISIPAYGIPFGFIILAYIALVIIIPEAKTVQDRYQMRGEDYTIDSISKKIEQSANQFERSAKEFTKKNSNFFYVLFRAVCIVIGVSFLIAGASALITLLLCTLGALPLPAALLGAISGVFGVGTSVVASIALLAIVCIPLIMLVYLGILLTFNMKSPKWKPGLWSFLLWILAIITFAITCAGSTLQYIDSRSEFYDKSYPLEPNKELTIVMEGADDRYDYVSWEGDRDDYELALINDNMLYVYPDIKLRRSDDNEDIFVESEKLVFRHRDSDRDKEYFTYENGVLTIKPTVFNKYHGPSEFGYKVIINIPSDYEVELIGTESFGFHNHREYSNIFPFKNVFLGDFDLDFDF